MNNRCNECQKPMLEYVRSYDEKLRMFYCESCDLAMCIDGKTTVKIKDFRKRLEYNHERIKFDFLRSFDLYYLGKYLPKNVMNKIHFLKGYCLLKMEITQQLKRLAWL
ncbi:MAG: hypothetical protein DRP01_03490 [Archaeoglobales archaeon]|nr:MAG: hypothetical protein DRP01_03490 [Archaeoglobales archaeon]